MKSTLRFLPILGAVSVLGGLSGCANYEVNTKRGDIPGHYIRYEMQEADRAVEAARQVGKDKICPAEFKDAEAAKNNAYDVFRACHTEEGSALAKQATAKANALCPPQAAPPAPAPVPPPAPAPKPVPAPPAPAPVPLVPSANIGVTPATVTKGQTATLAWGRGLCPSGEGEGSEDRLGHQRRQTQNDLDPGGHRVARGRLRRDRKRARRRAKEALPRYLSRSRSPRGVGPRRLPCGRRRRQRRQSGAGRGVPVLGSGHHLPRG